VVRGREAEALRGLTAVDGSLLPALPRMAWALWQGGGGARAAKMHVHFDVLKAVPLDATVTPAACSECLAAWLISRWSSPRTDGIDAWRR